MVKPSEPVKTILRITGSGEELPIGEENYNWPPASDSAIRPASPRFSTTT